ncbi:hypothetical protein [Streptomyces sp. NBC_01235]|uniref:hypothetical protein n=1 Tax=Streptomyces sp. NBC_01235 TaxID=2903788 RepID=UPI002E13217F|nr:hypothetical protein OG289_30850 [Streptomyces sp. NBC_01235]
MSSRSSFADGCVLAVLLLAEVAFGLMFALVIAMAGHPTGMLVWLGVMALAALGAAVLLFRDGHPTTGAAQATASLFLVALMAVMWPR